MSTTLAYVRQLFRWSRKRPIAHEEREVVHCVRALYLHDNITPIEALTMLEALGVDAVTRDKLLCVWDAIKGAGLSSS